jgi:hypothetical protein
MNKTFTSLSRLALLFGACAVTLPASPAYPQGKAKAKNKVEAEGKHGRGAGELPYGLQQDCKKGRIKTVNLLAALRKVVKT